MNTFKQNLLPCTAYGALIGLVFNVIFTLYCSKAGGLLEFTYVKIIAIVALFLFMGFYFTLSGIMAGIILALISTVLPNTPVFKAKIKLTILTLLALVFVGFVYELFASGGTSYVKYVTNATLIVYFLVKWNAIKNKTVTLIKH